MIHPTQPETANFGFTHNPTGSNEMLGDVRKVLEDNIHLERKKENCFLEFSEHA